MALLQVHFFSESLGLSTSMNVILPQQARGQIGLKGVGTEGGPVSTLYLLHGLSDDHSIWMRRTSIERYVAGLPLAVVMPEVHRSFYQNMAHGTAYWTFISEELPVLVHQFFKLPQIREHTFVAGLSMGGYGAFRLALEKPECFAAAASLSGALDLPYDMEVNPNRLNTGSEKIWDNVFGPGVSIRGTRSDLIHLVGERAASSGRIPKLYQCCGTSDFLYQHNQNFRKAAESAGLDLTYEEGPGSHEWGYWDTQIQRILKWLPMP